MQVIVSLANQGYALSVDQDQIVIKYIGQGHPDPATVRSLLDELKEHKAEALEYLRRSPDDADKLTAGTLDECISLDSSCREHIRRKGYCLVKSQALGGETFAVVEDDARCHLAPAGYVVYTLRELEILVEGYRRGNIATIGDLRLLHTAKKSMKGRLAR